MRNQVPDRRRGTTLIELLVVLGVIAILMAALVPSLRRTMTLARSTVCMHNLHQIGQGLAQYRYDNDGWLPVDTSNAAVANANSDAVWFCKLYPTYLPDPVVLTCPEDPFRARMLKVTDVLREPRVQDYASYGINGFIVTANGGQMADLDRRWPARPLDNVLAADLGPDDVMRVAGDDAATGPDRNASLLAWDDGYDPIDQPVVPNPWVTTRHGFGINVLTIDGGIRAAHTKKALAGPIQRYYPECYAGGCTLCTDLHLYHYSFWRDRLYWWTGPPM